VRETECVLKVLLTSQQASQKESSNEGAARTKERKFRDGILEISNVRFLQGISTLPNWLLSAGYLGFAWISDPSLINFASLCAKERETLKRDGNIYIYSIFKF